MAKKKRFVESEGYTQSGFAMLWRAGAFTHVWMESNGAKFVVAGTLASGQRVDLVLERRPQIRMFLNPAAALMALRRIGVMRVEVRMEKWDLDLAALSMRMRPDVVARRLRDQRAAEAAYFPNREPEPEVADRTDQWNKLLEKKMEQLRRTAPPAVSPIVDRKSVQKAIYEELKKPVGDPKAVVEQLLKMIRHR